MPSQGDVVLIPVPFTDLSSARRRPVIVISNDAYNRTTTDMVVVGMTSNLTPHPHSFLLTSADLVSGTLKHPGRVRVDKIYTLSQGIAVKTFGKVNDATLDRIRQMLADLCRPEDQSRRTKHRREGNSMGDVADLERPHENQPHGDPCDSSGTLAPVGGPGGVGAVRRPERPSGFLLEAPGPHEGRRHRGRKPRTHSGAPGFPVYP
jgi:mRNA interferase MazF